MSSWLPLRKMQLGPFPAQADQALDDAAATTGRGRCSRRGSRWCRRRPAAARRAGARARRCSRARRRSTKVRRAHGVTSLRAAEHRVEQAPVGEHARQRRVGIDLAALDLARATRRCAPLRIARSSRRPSSSRSAATNSWRRPAAARARALAALDQVAAMSLDGVDQLVDARAAPWRRSSSDRALPTRPPGRSCSIELELRLHARGAVAIGLVDDEHVGDLEQPGLHRLDRVARFRHQHDDDGLAPGA